MPLPDIQIRLPNTRTQPSPIPLDPPVTTTTLPLKRSPCAAITSSRFCETGLGTGAPNQCWFVNQALSVRPTPDWLIASGSQGCQVFPVQWQSSVTKLDIPKVESSSSSAPQGQDVFELPVRLVTRSCVVACHTLGRGEWTGLAGKFQFQPYALKALSSGVCLHYETSG